MHKVCIPIGSTAIFMWINLRSPTLKETLDMKYQSILLLEFFCVCKQCLYCHSTASRVPMDAGQPWIIFFILFLVNKWCIVLSVLQEAPSSDRFQCLQN